MDTSIVEKLAQVKLLILDVDGVMTDGKIYFNEQGECLKAFNVKDGLGITMLLRCNIHVAIISGRSSPIIQKRANELGVKHVYVGQLKKLEAYKHCIEQLTIQPNQVAYLGDDVNDLPIMKQIGLSITPADAFDEMKKASMWVTTRNGGNGAVREVCNAIIMAQEKWSQAMKIYEN